MTQESQHSTLHDLAAGEAQLAIDRAQLSSMLVALGVDLTHPLCASFIVGAFDVMACVEIADNLPADYSFEDAVQCFETMRQPQPIEVREVQIKVLDAVCGSAATIDQVRIESLRRWMAESTPA